MTISARWYGQWARKIFFVDSLYFGEIPARKLLLVYSHWSIFLIFLVFLFLSLTIWRREASSVFFGLSKWGQSILSLYIIIMGLTFFNRIFFTHSMFDWGFFEHLKFSLRSIAYASLPIIVILISQCIRKEKTSSIIGLVGFFIIIHSLMTLMYLLNPLYGIE